MKTQTTIQCACPQCGRICGFKGDYAGRIARCLNCRTRFIIPAETSQATRLLKPQPVAAVEGFYTNAVKGSLKAFAQPESRPGLVFCTALVVFHFLLGNEDLSFTLPGFRVPLLIGWLVTLLTFGCFAWYCLEMIAATRPAADALPPVELGAGFEFLWILIKSCYLFFVSLLIAFLPASFISAWFEHFGVDIGNAYYLLVVLCLFFWPINLALIAGEESMWRIFRCDLLCCAIARTFVPYVFTTLVTLAAFYVVFLGMFFFASDEEITWAAALGFLALRLVGAMLFLFAMRVIGVYCAHYADVCPELWVTTPPQTPGSS